MAALLSRYLEYVGGKEDDGNAKIIQDSLQVEQSVFAYMRFFILEVRQEEACKYSLWQGKEAFHGCGFFRSSCILDVCTAKNFSCFA